jgi:dolichyl-phosphate beta-glucosyltransferase
MKELSIIIPAYNEEKRLREAIESLVSEHDKNFSHEYEIIIVNDGSCDNTVGVIGVLQKKYHQIHSLHLKKNKGKGFAVKEGVLHSEGRYVMYLDADGATNPKDVCNIIEARSSADFIIASRAIKNSCIVVGQPRWRKFLGAKSIRFAKSINKLPIFDTQCGCKILRRDVAIELFGTLFTPRWLFDIELLRKAYKKGYSIKEWPVRWSNIPGSKVNLWSYCTSLWELLWIMVRT